MKYLINYLLVILSLIGCATKGVVERDLSKSTRKICLSSEGKGRIMALDHKYIFSYESSLDADQAVWQLALNFPLHKTETFKLDWSSAGKVKFESSIEQRILKENTDINPKSLEAFSRGLGHLLEEIIQLRTLSVSKRKKMEKRYLWKSTTSTIFARSRDKKFNAQFKNLVGNEYFGLMILEYKDKLAKQTYKMDLVVRNCLETSPVM